MLGEFGEQTQAKKNAICDKLIAQYEADEQAALKRKLVLVQISKRRYQVIRLNGTTATHPGAVSDPPLKGVGLAGRSRSSPG